MLPWPGYAREGGLSQAPCGGPDSLPVDDEGSGPMVFTRGLEEVDATQVALVGGKGAQLGELARIPGVRVPAGFCVTTAAYRAALAGLHRPDRAAVLAAPVPDGLVDDIGAALDRLGPDAAYAVRSSATAEDLPSASFAGQHDSYLGVVGRDAVVEHVRLVWASLFGDRAVTYREQQGIGHDAVEMAVVVQQMVEPRAAGVLFTADPLSGNRSVATIDAVHGLADELVSGRATPDVLRVQDGVVVERSTADPGQPVLTDDEALRLVALGRIVEEHAGLPQDVEWCLTRDGGFELVQARPVTTLFPVPVAADDAFHVYVSVGHGQMMTDPMRPLGLSLWQLTALPPMHEAAGRLFVDVTAQLSRPRSRAAVLDALGTGDPLIGDALRTVLATGSVPELPDPEPTATSRYDAPPAEALPTDPSVVDELVAATDAAVRSAEQTLAGATGPAVFEAIRADLLDLKRLLTLPRSSQVIMAAMDAARWLNEHVEQRLGDRNVVDVLSRSVPGNVTSEMGLALMDVADVVRPHPEVVAVLETAGDDVLDRLAGVEGGDLAQAALRGYLDAYGMRCVGEIDVTRPRWVEQPSAVLPALLADARGFAPGEGRRRFEQGRREAEEKEREVLARLRALPDGEGEAARTQENIAVVRTFAGFREYPKYGIVRRFLAYKRALLREADALVAAGVLARREDCFDLTFDELEEAVRTGEVEPGLVARRQAAFATYGALRPPRVLTSEGEALDGEYRRDDLPPGALVGLAVSGGTVEGRARVVHDAATADVGPGDVLVTTHTDPSWSPLFAAVSGLVTEVGGLMTHGAVIAREYGLPAVVGVRDATRLIRDGARVRVHGTDGFVELLPVQPVSGARDG